MTKSAVAMAPIFTLRQRLRELMLNWQERREERRVLREFEEHMLRELALTRNSIRRHFRAVRFTTCWRMT